MEIITLCYVPNTINCLVFIASTLGKLTKPSKLMPHNALFCAKRSRTLPLLSGYRYQVIDNGFIFAWSFA
jgi:hypothetical protein